MYSQGSPVEIQTPARWTLIGRSISPAVCAIAQQYSSVTLVSWRFQYRREKFRSAFKKVV